MFPFVKDINSDTAIKMFCFHHAGGTASVFREWVTWQDRLAIYPVELPGKATRLSERYIHSGEKLISKLAAEIDRVLLPNEKFYLFGHSMGAMIAFKVAFYLEKIYARQAEKVILVARHAADVEEKIGYQTYMGDEALIGDLKRIGGTPDEILDNKDIINCLLPGIISDYKLNDNLLYLGEVINSPIRIDIGENDTDTPFELVKRWRSLTTNKTDINNYPGGHFFLYDLKKTYYNSLEDEILKRRGIQIKDVEL